MPNRLPVAAATMLAISTIPGPKTGGQAVLAEVLSVGLLPINATKLAIFPNELSCQKHMSELEQTTPLLESRVALTEYRIHYDQTLRCFPSKTLWTYWLHTHCLEGSQCS